ncbi:MAG: NAD(P)/FAD-dependent oxidoreductase [Halobacteriota archaeon]
MTTVVVGGGIVGLASAYHLADAGADVVLLERGSLGTQSTGRSAGGIRQQFSTPVNVEFSRASLPVWERFEERFGVDIALRQTGYLFLARNSATAERFEANVAMQRELGVDAEFIEPEAAVEHCAGLDPAPFEAATYLGTDGFADPNLAVQGYASAARTAGVDIRTKTPVTDLVVERDAVVGVETVAGRIAADAVVLAAGAWTSELAAKAGVDLPISPRRRQVATVEPDEPVPETDPLTIDLDVGSYFRPERGGLAIVGGHFDGTDPPVDPDGYDTSYDLPWALAALERAAAYTSYFGPETRIRDGWAGLYAVTPDHHAIIDEARPGLVVAAGFSGHGFQHAPATGRVVSELVVEGSASTVDIGPLGSDRFEAGETAVERNVA